MTVGEDPGKHQVYQIRVQGKLDESWADWFSGMTIQRECAEDSSYLTTLTGPVADQATLRGILNRIWDLNLNLISIHSLGFS